MRRTVSLALQEGRRECVTKRSSTLRVHVIVRVGLRWSVHVCGVVRVMLNFTDAVADDDVAAVPEGVVSDVSDNVHVVLC